MKFSSQKLKGIIYIAFILWILFIVINSIIETINAFSVNTIKKDMDIVKNIWLIYNKETSNPNITEFLKKKSSTFPIPPGDATDYLVKGLKYILSQKYEIEENEKFRYEISNKYDINQDGILDYTVVLKGVSNRICKRVNKIYVMDWRKIPSYPTKPYSEFQCFKDGDTNVIVYLISLGK